MNSKDSIEFQYHWCWYCVRNCFIRAIKRRKWNHSAGQQTENSSTSGGGGGYGYTHDAGPSNRDPTAKSTFTSTTKGQESRQERFGNIQSNHCNNRSPHHSRESAGTAVTTGVCTPHMRVHPLSVTTIHYGSCQHFTLYPGNQETKEGR